MIEEVRRTMGVLRNNTPHLFDNDLHELTLVHQVACLLKESKNFSGYSVDLEYNRLTSPNQGQIIKKTFEGDPKDFFRPDLIIHVPGTQLANLLVIEFSKERNTEREEDKLREMTKRNGKYRYRLGILIDLPKYESWKYFIDGELFDKVGAEERLKYFETGAVEAFNTLNNINFNYTVREEDMQESRVQVEMAKNSGSNFNWDIASNDSESIYSRNTDAFREDWQNFQSEFKRYFRLVTIPEYLRCTEIIECLYNNTLPKANQQYPEAFFDNDDWFLYSDDIFPYLRKLLLYCHYSIVGKGELKHKLFSELGQIKMDEDFIFHGK